MLFTDKAKPAKRQGRKATGPRFLREVIIDSSLVLTTAGLQIMLPLWTITGEDHGKAQHKGIDGYAGDGDTA